MLKRLVLHGATCRPAAVALAALIALAGCARGGAGGAPEPEPVPGPAAPASDSLGGPSLLEVRNLSNYDVRISVMVGAARGQRLGLVVSQATTTFRLDARFIGRDVRLLAEPVGFRGTQRTDAFVLRAGQLVIFGLEKQLRSHTLAVHFL